MGLDSEAADPFEIPDKPDNLPIYATPVTVINSVLFKSLDAIFSYKTFGERDLFDAAIKKWLSTPDPPYFKELEIRNGAGLTPLGYSQSQKGICGIITPGYGLKYFVEPFRREGKFDTKFVFNVGSLDYLDDTGALTNDYVLPLRSAANLGLTVVSPVSLEEIRATTTLTVALAKYGKGIGAAHLFDGVNYARSYLPLGTTQDSDLLKDLDTLGLARNLSVEEVLENFNRVSPVKLDHFQYSGVEAPETVFLVHASEFSLFKSVLEKNVYKTGIIGVRIPIPFNTGELISLLRASTKRVVVVSQSTDESTSSWLKETVSAALFYSGRRDIRVSQFIYKPDFVWSRAAARQVVRAHVPTLDDSETARKKALILWSSDTADLLNVTSQFVQDLATVKQHAVSYRSKFDNISNAGVFQAQISQLAFGELQPLSDIDQASMSFVEDVKILEVFNVLATVRENGTIVIVTRNTLAGIDLTQPSTFFETLRVPPHFWNSVNDKNIRVVFVDAAAVAGDANALSLVCQAAIWKYGIGLTLRQILQRFEDSKYVVSANELSEALSACLYELPEETYLLFDNPVEEEGTKEVDVVEEGADSRDDNVEKHEFTSVVLPAYVTENALKANPRFIVEESRLETDSLSSIAKKLAFKEAFGTKFGLRPDLSGENFIIKVKENKRVTPAYYDRHIFEIEFDLAGTGLKYDIGEALGVHSRNNLDAVKAFLAYYGLNEHQVVNLPSRDNPNVIESKSVLHIFLERVDLFGKPPKKFYEAFAEFVQDEDERRKLEFLVSPAGASELKRYQDDEFFTYVDIFEMYPSARPPLPDLIRIIAPLKRREYSIASSQKVHPNELHLLVVVVDWVDKRGRKRYGHTSKFMSGLSVGSELVVSVKPSVMKLPPSPQQPVIMSGLGTGLAPFKAIVEEKMWQREQGYEIGEVFLFLGSRHKREEYLYGELWEAYKDAGIITHIGAAFSRDQPQKIYIQDRIRQILPKLQVAMMDNVGSFYLCGPTWPVPDITQALKDIIEADSKAKGIKVNLDETIEELKESSRYVLEVY